MAEEYIIGSNAQFNDSVEILKDLTLYGVVENSTDFAVKIQGDEKLRITSDGVLIGDTISHIGDVDTKIRFPENDVISFETEGSERLRIATPSARGIVSFVATDAQDVIHITTGNVSGDTFSNIRGDNQSGIRIRGGGSYGGGMIELAGGLRNTDPGIIKFHTGTDITNNNTERLRIASGGMLIKGHTESAGQIETQLNQQNQFHGNDRKGGIRITDFSDSAFSANLEFVKSRNATIGQNTILQNGDSIGSIYWGGANGTNFQPGAFLTVKTDGTVSSTSMPTAITFGTNAGDNLVERFRIDDSAVKVESKLACISDTDTNIEFSGTNQIVFNAANNERMRLVGNGNLGIGTPDPGGYRVAIRASGVSPNGGGLLLDDATTTSAAPYLNIVGRRSDDNTSFPFGGVIYLTGQRTDAKVAVNKVLGAIAFGGNHSSSSEDNQRYAASVIGIADDSFDGSTDMPTALAFLTSDTGITRSTLNTSAGTERMRITSDGQVLINTTSSINSQAYLEVQGGTSHGQTNYIQTWKGDSDNIAIRNHVAGDYEFVNSQEGNEVSIYDGTGGVRLEYYDNGNYVGMYNNFLSSNRAHAATTTGGVNLNIAGSGSYYAIRRNTSSQRYKDNIREYVGLGVSAIKQMIPKLWEDHNEGFTKLGFIAEDIHNIGLTNAVEYEEYIGGSEIGIGVTYGDMYGNGTTPVTKTGEALDDEVLVVDGIDNTAIIAELVIAVKQLTARIETLESGG